MASDEQFSLCWNNFHANMSAGFHGLLSRGDLVDVTLAAEGRLLQAHKLVLSVCSPYFQEMFKMNPTHHPIVFLKDVSHSALRDLLQFMYQGEVNVKQEELASFISTAEQLQVKGLTGNQNEESSTPSKPKPTSRPGPRSSQQRQSVMTKLETDLDSKPSSTPVAIKRPNRPSIASNNSSSSQSGPVKRKCVDPLEAGPSGSAKEEFVTIPDEDENNAVAPKMEPEFVNESMWDEDDDGTNNDETNFGEDDSNMEMSGFDGSTTGDGNITGGGEGGAVGDAQVEHQPHTPRNITNTSINNTPNTGEVILQVCEDQNMLSDKIDKMVNMIHNQNKIIENMVNKMCIMPVQLEDISEKLNQPRNEQPVQVTLLKDVRQDEAESFCFNIIENQDQFDALEVKLGDKSEYKKLKKLMSFLCSPSTGGGKTFAYRLLDTLLSREFICSCSWSGGSRGEKSKIALKNYKLFRKFFFDMVHSWDAEFTLEASEIFFKTVLKNSGKRKLMRDLRASVAKRRKNKNPAK
ncbi:protein tramtrack, beta isoform-like isoform X3 [Maniola jurtina]|uniref:protein tramtrack, beta isoform-like isoform X3 n=1 Tax=Maniola jurtina TaxID=191418 RepID=UPI001E68A485|nr:protein tramtrack, beta isoform-like isoform X3 [Maniola jurtina]